MPASSTFHAFLSITENRSRILAFIVAMVRDFEVADDLFQETVLEILKSEDRFDPARWFTPWACAIARNVVRAYWRRRNFEQWKKTGSDRPYHYLGSAIRHNRIGKAFARAMLELLGKK